MLVNKILCTHFIYISVSFFYPSQIHSLDINKLLAVENYLRYRSTNRKFFSSFGNDFTAIKLLTFKLLLNTNLLFISYSNEILKCNMKSYTIIIKGEMNILITRSNSSSEKFK